VAGTATKRSGGSPEFAGRLLAGLWRQAPAVGVDLWDVTLRGNALTLCWAAAGRLRRGWRQLPDPAGAPPNLDQEWLAEIGSDDWFWEDAGSIPELCEVPAERRDAQAELLEELVLEARDQHYVDQVLWIGVSRRFVGVALILRWVHGGQTYHMASPFPLADAGDVYLHLMEGPSRAIHVDLVR
jgi:hypothetical protein